MIRPGGGRRRAAVVVNFGTVTRLEKYPLPLGLVSLNPPAISDGLGSSTIDQIVVWISLLAALPKLSAVFGCGVASRSRNCLSRFREPLQLTRQVV